MSPAAALRILHDVPTGDISLTAVGGWTMRFPRAARLTTEQAELLAGLRLTQELTVFHNNR